MSNETKTMTPEERSAKRAGLLQLLLIILAGVAIVYLGVEIGLGVTTLAYFFFRVIFGGGSA